jgi:pimeloyl-ACP methyl ester carboxylesterase
MPLRRPAVGLTLAGALCAMAAGLGGGAEPDQQPGPTERLPKLEIPRLDSEVPLPTLGGKQFWTDCLFFHQWRIQRNARSGEFRLLDADDFQHASGGYVECRAKLEEIKRTQHLAPMKGKVVIVLHGLFRSRSSMSKLCKYLEAKGGYTVLNMSYASTQRDVAAHARALDQIVSQLGGVEEINFVGHSLGNIVVRRYLHDQAHRADGRPPEKRIRRFVMLAPPNHGSVVAAALADSPVVSAVTGEAGRELGHQWAKLEAHLGTPPCQFGIIAGGLGNEHGLNPFIPGDDDGTVSVVSTRLGGAADFVLVPALHSFIMNDSKAIEYTLRFLQKGYFIAPDKRHEIRKEEKKGLKDEG